GTSGILGQTNAGELPGGLGRKEVAVGRPDVGFRSGAGAASKDKLVAHELAVILTERTRSGLVAGIWCVRTTGPLPQVTEEPGQRCIAPDCVRTNRMIVFLLHEIAGHGSAGRCNLPFLFRG